MYRLIIVWAVLLVLAANSLYKEEQEVDLKIGMLKTVDTIHPLIAKEKGYFQEEGLNYSIHSFGTSTALAEAVASGDIDIAYMSVVPAAIWKERGVDVMIVAGVSRGGDIVCTRSGGVTGKIAVSGKGTMTQIVYETYVEDKFAYEPIYGIEPADMPTALLITKDIDSVITWEPFASEIEKNGGVCIFDVGKEWEKEYGTKYQRNVLVVSRRVLNDTKLLQKVLSVHNKTIAYLNSPEADQSIAKAMGITPLDSRRVEYNATLDWESMKMILETAKKNGYLKKIPEKEDIVYGG